MGGIYPGGGYFGEYSPDGTAPAGGTPATGGSGLSGVSGLGGTSGAIPIIGPPWWPPMLLLVLEGWAHVVC